MNTFLSDTNTRLLEWKTLRSKIKSVDDLSELVNWLSNAPLCNFVMDWDKPEEWLTPWEIIADNVFCDTALAYLIHQSIVLGENDINATITRIKSKNDETIVVVVNDVYVLNFSHNEIVTVDFIKEHGYNFVSKYQYDGERYSLISML